jgi:acyl-CoA thioester hydrolase
MHIEPPCVFPAAFTGLAEPLQSQDILTFPMSETNLSETNLSETSVAASNTASVGAAEQPFIFRSRIRFVDTDASRRIHYTAMLRHFEAAEHEFLSHIGFPYSQISSREVGFPRVHVEVDFQSATTYNDLLEIEVWVARIGGSSFTFAFRACVEGRQAASGRIVVAAMSPATKKSCPVPATLAESLRPYLREA